MKPILLTVLPIALSVSACASNDTLGAGPTTAKRFTYGAAAGALIGGLAGAALGADPVTGVALGTIAGGAVGAAMPGPVVNGRQYYRDTRGYCYFINAEGQPQYDGTVRC